MSSTNSYGLTVLGLVSLLSGLAAVLATDCPGSTNDDFVLPPFTAPPDYPVNNTNLQVLLSLLFSTVPLVGERETPVAVRSITLLDTMTWNCVASYHPSYNSAYTGSFFQDLYPVIRADDEATYTTDARQLCGIYAAAVAWPSMFENSDTAIPIFLEGFHATMLGLTEEDFGVPADLLEFCPGEDGATDHVCLEEYVECHGYAPKAMGAVIAYQLLHYADRDGFNNKGQLAKGGRECSANCRPFQDSTNYDPTDPRDESGCRSIPLTNRTRDLFSENPERNACWTPLQEDVGRGFFVRQEHVTPHIGTQAFPRLISKEEVQERRASPPNYDYRKEMRLAFRRAARLDDRQKMIVEWGDDKLVVVQSIFFAIIQNFGEDKFTYERVLLFLIGYIMTELDSVIVAWNEKVRHNLIRPTTVAQRINPLGTVDTYVNGQGVQTITRADFQPYKRTMPHAEYPSGSSCIFQSVNEYVPGLLDYLFGDEHDIDDFPIVVQFEAGSSNVEPGITPAEPLTLEFSTLREAMEDGSQSRLWGGMHFTASVEAGKQVCAGIGDAGVEFIKALTNGVPPEISHSG